MTKLRETMVAYSRAGPPWYIRLVGLSLLVADMATYLYEKVHGHQVTGIWEIAIHALWAVVALTMAYPEGGRLLMGFLRKTVPSLDRRIGRR